jgi:fibronectin type 3 domain-containing protein
MNIRRLWLIAVCLALALSAAIACGRKTPPLVPESPRPEAVKDLKAVTRDSIAFLSWPIPTRNIEGKNIGQADLRRFRVYRAEIGRDRKRPRYKLFVELDMANPAPASVRSGMVFWTDRNLRYGQLYGYRIRAVSARGGVSAQSDEARVAPLLSLAVPKGLVAQGGDGNNQLAWEPVTTRMDGSRYEGFVGYNVYRGAEKGRYEETPLNKEPVRTTSYKDTAAANDRTYFYMVRSVDSPTLPWRESLDSAEASATPRDMTPPDRPTGLTVVPGIGRAFLTWNENKERDLAGYHVYRSKKSGKDYERLTDKPLGRTTFSDETVKAGAMYYYIVTAVDLAGNESAGSVEKKASSEKLR